MITHFENSTKGWEDNVASLSNPTTCRAYYPLRVFRSKKRIWVSSSRGTCWVCVRPDGIISDCDALWKRFRGQPFESLIKWLRDAQIVEINKLEETL